MRELLAHEASDPDCRLAVDVYCYEIRKRLGAYAAALGGLDAIVFSGGIGERAGAVRARICEGLQFLGVAIEPARNAADAEVISTDAARVPVHVIRTDEEAILAQAGSALLKDVT
jgi:acetate kinase